MELLTLRFTAVDNAHFNVTAEWSGGEASPTQSKLPFFETSVERRTTLIKTLGAIKFRPDDFRPDEQEWMLQTGILTSDRNHFHPDYLKLIGKALYDSLFPEGQVRDSLQRAMELVERNNYEQLHVQLRFDSEVAQLRLPDYSWELVFDGRRFLAHHRVTFSRYIAHLNTPSKIPPVERINVLLVSSSASDKENGFPPLSQKEQDVVRKALEKAQKEKLIHLELLPKPVTFKRLQDYLTEHRDHRKTPQVLHFDGHGCFGRRCSGCHTIHSNLHIECCKNCSAALANPQGFLMFETDENTAHYVSAEEFGELLQSNSLGDHPKQERGIRLAVLSACKAAMALGRNSVFNGVAQNLINHEVPSVVAMQYNVTVDSATAFVEQFYKLIGQGESLTTAVKHGRSAMGIDQNQWYRPVLYLRWADNEGGQLFSQRRVPPDPPIWRRLFTAALCSIAVTIGVGIIRSAGCLQYWELSAYDQLMNLRPTEDWDKRVVVIGIDKMDQGQHKSVSDYDLKNVLSKLKADYKAKVIGVDIYRDSPQERDNSSKSTSRQDWKGLANYIKDKKIIAICRSKEDEVGSEGVKPPVVNDPEDELTSKMLDHSFKNARNNTNAQQRKLPIYLGPGSLGFSDIVNDDEDTPDRGPVRRHLLMMPKAEGSPCTTEYSLSYQVAAQYLTFKGYKFVSREDKYLAFRNSKTNKEVILYPLGVTLLTTDGPSAGYQVGHGNYDPGPYQVMLNYRAVGKTTPLHSLQEVSKISKGSAESEKLKKEIESNIVLIGYNDLKLDRRPRDIQKTPIDSEMPGVVLQAHMVSQIISAALDDRSLIWYWSPEAELLWIWAWSLLGGILIWRKKSLLWLGIITLGLPCVLCFICYLFFLQAGWIPLVPTTLASIFTSGVMIMIDLQDRDLITIGLRKRELNKLNHLLKP